MTEISSSDNAAKSIRSYSDDPGLYSDNQGQTEPDLEDPTDKKGNLEFFGLAQEDLKIPKMKGNIRNIAPKLGHSDSIQALATVLSEPQKSKDILEVKKSKTYFAQLILSKTWPQGCSLLTMLISFFDKSDSFITSSYEKNNIKNSIVKDKQTCLEHIRNFINAYNKENKFSEYNTSNALSTIVLSPYTAPIILDTFEQILRKLFRRDQGCTGITFTYAEFVEAAVTVCRMAQQKALSYWANASSVVEAPRAEVFKFSLYEAGILSREELALSWNALINKQKKIKSGQDRNASVSRVNNSRGRGTGNGPSRPIRSTLQNKVQQAYPDTYKSLLKECRDGGYCVAYNYLTCPRGKSCFFAHKCSKCGEAGHTATNCRDNYDNIKSTLGQIQKK